MFLFVVNPKTPCLTVRVTGNAQFYTTPPKFYHLPKIHDQTTYILPRTGTVTFELRDINGNDVRYRINGGSWVDAEANFVTLDDTDFNDGSNTLEYFYEGNEDVVKTRPIIKNPGFPSAGEVHGNLIWGASNLLNTFRANRANTGSPVYAWWNEVKNLTSRNQTNAGLTFYGSKPAPQGSDKSVWGETYGHLNCALVAHEDGLSATRAGSGKTYAEFAKILTMQNFMRYEPVGLECDANGGQLPNRDIKDRGYYPVGVRGHFIEAILAYDLLIDIYKSTDHADGITPIEDFYLRDCFARWQVFNSCELGDYHYGLNPSTNMWERCQFIAAQLITLAMPKYSTPYYGTSGMDGNTAVYTGIPFPDVGLTWKSMFIDENHAVSAFPNPAHRAHYEGIFTSETDLYTRLDNVYIGFGAWRERQPYSEQILAGFPFGVLGMMAKLHTGKVYPRFFEAINRGKQGQLMAQQKLAAEPLNMYGPFYWKLPFVVNEMFPAHTDQHLTWFMGDAQRLNDVFKYGYGLACVWFDPSFEESAPGDSTPPTILQQTIPTTGDRIDFVFSEPVVAVSSAHFTMSGGRSFGTMTGSGTNWSAPISPVAVRHEAITIGYTSGVGRTADTAGNLMASFAGQVVTNESLETTPIPARAGRRGRGAHIFPLGR
jgi:hypothetical protein